MFWLAAVLYSRKEAEQDCQVSVAFEILSTYKWLSVNAFAAIDMVVHLNLWRGVTKCGILR